MKFKMLSLTVMLTVVCSLMMISSAEARSHHHRSRTNVSFNFGVLAPRAQETYIVDRYYPAYAQPVYVAPQPAYIAPQPVYVAPTPIAYVAPQPCYRQVYVAPQPVCQSGLSFSWNAFFR